VLRRLAQSEQRSSDVWMSRSDGLLSPGATTLVFAV
jgi:hypothetical protein